jgi:hypothetical protein
MDLLGHGVSVSSGDSYIPNLRWNTDANPRNILDLKPISFRLVGTG